MERLVQSLVVGCNDRGEGWRVERSVQSLAAVGSEKGEGW